MGRGTEEEIVVKSADVSEDEILKRFRQGEVEVFDELVRRFQAPLYNLLYRMCRDEDKARDYLQETFLRAFRGLKDFRGESKLGTWLSRIAVNTFLKRHEKDQEVPADPLMVEEFWQDAQGQPGPPDPGEILVHEEGRQKILEAIGRLPAEYRAVLLLRDREGLSAKEVAETLDLSVAAVKSRLHRARLFLRKELEPYYATA